MNHIQEYAKAYASAAAIIITFLVGEVGFDLPEEITGAVTVLLTGIIVALVPNKPKEEHPLVEVPPKPFGGSD